MVNFIKNSSLYGLFILESDSVNNDDWITDHAGLIKEADWDLYTEGTEGVHLPYVSNMKRLPEFEIDTMDFFMGEGVLLGQGVGHDLIMFEGRFGGANEAERNTKMANLILLAMKHIRAGDELIYIGYRKIGEVWEPFFSPTPATIYYLKGIFAAVPSYERAEDELYYKWKVIFRGL